MLSEPKSYQLCNVTEKQLQCEVQQLAEQGDTVNRNSCRISLGRTSWGWCLAQGYLERRLEHPGI